MDTNTSLPLYKFFETLRKNGFELGIDDYYALIDVIHQGFWYDKNKSILDKENIFFICETLWFKPNQSKYEFKNMFDDNFEYIDLTNQETNNSNAENPLDSNLDPDNSIDAKKEENDNLNDNSEESDNLQEEENDNLNDNIQENQIDENSEDKAEKVPNNTPIKQEEFRIKVELSNVNDKGENIEETKEERKRKFLFSDNYFDISLRQMQQVCRSLPIFQITSSNNQIDIDATILNWAKKGFFEKNIYQNKQNLYNKVILLVDNKGSMQAFETLINNLNTALKDAFDVGTKHEKQAFETYYFYNLPQDYVYMDTTHVAYKEKKQLLKEIKKDKSLVIILSDAGASRGGNSDGRFKASLRFVIQLQKVSSQIVWLNPMPKTRWAESTAHRIARFLPMFPLTNQRELQQSINILKGKSKWNQ